MPNVFNGTEDVHSVGVSPLVEYYLKGILLPAIGLFGCIGNFLNLLVLSWRYKCRRVDVLEKGALLGLIGLAISDFFFSLGLIPFAFFYKTKTMFMSPTVHMYFQLYGSYYQNVFLRISSWLTLLVGLARYFVICHPFHARIFIGLPGIRGAIGFIFVLWIAFLLPMLWTYSVSEWSSVNGSTVYYLDIGVFSGNKQMKMTFMYLWSVLGFGLPAIIVAFCNLRLIFALRESMKLRAARARRKNATDWDYSVRITATLVALIIAFILLVSPSEILHFYGDVIKAKTFLAFETAVILTNILQATNFAFHFILYCAVNVNFRRTLLIVFRKKCIFERRAPSTLDRMCRASQPIRQVTTRRAQKSSHSIESFV